MRRTPDARTPLDKRRGRAVSRGGLDPWKGIRPGDRLYRVHPDHAYQGRVVVTDLWYDPVRGQDSRHRGCMVGLREADEAWEPVGRKWGYPAATVAGRGYLRAEVAEEWARGVAAAALRALGVEP